jgi:hypothetical protein
MMSLSSLKARAVSASVHQAPLGGVGHRGRKSLSFRGGPAVSPPPGANTAGTQLLFPHFAGRLPRSRCHSKAIQHGSASGNCKLLASRPKAARRLTRLRILLYPVTERILEEELNKLSSTYRRNTGLARHFALALALASGTAMLAAPAFTDAAHAQKRDKKKKEEPKAAYSKEFVAAYQPLDEALKAEGADVNALRPQIDALLPLLVSPDEQLAGGGLIYNAGNKGGDRALQLKGMEMMLNSGKLSPEDFARYNFVAYQLANAVQDYAKSRAYLQRAIDNNFTTETVTRPISKSPWPKAISRRTNSLPVSIT